MCNISRELLSENEGLNFIVIIADGSGFDPYAGDGSAFDPYAGGRSTPNVEATCLQRLSNVADGGLWAFRVDGASIISGGAIIIIALCVIVCVHMYARV